ncbi:hypothetical protein FB565_007448 [Actinoplanes lutulentus]|uniref:Sigma-70-like protein n=1 Tax=Actinoplanes lutulentus TaxID=1287878 RepID=A0A327Z503_9ACTN|nr:hypothetical protein [Actinoplanes lutulentus]MBB2947677.1 hypothetical protein [Actinoplanes lutulentus]RAK27733.1 hypothetical protein B0I29_122116 [Actinoplanes lutulentus]
MSKVARGFAPSVEDGVLIEWISQGNKPAFIALFDRTSADVRAVLSVLPPGIGQRDEVLAATYLEVWWLAGCHSEPGIDAVAWLFGIAQRRMAELRGLVDGVVANPRPSYAQLELAALLGRPVSSVVGL